MNGWHLVHELTGWHGWAWQGWQTLVAVGTLMLAGFTAYLALRTRALAIASRSELSARSRPALVTAEDTIMAVEASGVRKRLPDAAYVHTETMILGVRNVGEGPAFNARFRANRWMNESDIMTLAVGDAAPMMLTLVDGWIFSVSEGATFSVVLEYEDIAQHTYYTKIALSIEDLTDPRQYAEVQSVVVYRDDEKPPETDFGKLASQELS
jgi:hypothetical protein